MKSRFLGAVAAMAMVFATPCMAQSSDVSPAQLEAKRTMARELMALTSPDMDKQIIAYMAQVIQQSGLSTVNAEAGSWMEKNAGRIMLPHIRSVMDKTVDIYARTYTVEELEGQLAFYKSPVGLSIARKQVALGIETGELLQPMMTEYTTDLFTQLCAAIDCDATK